MIIPVIMSMCKYQFVPHCTEPEWETKKNIVYSGMDMININSAKLNDNLFAEY